MPDKVQTVLVVDDEPDIRKTIKMVLGAEGYEVLEATQGAEALTLLARESPDAVLLDIKMPGMDGIEVLQAIRRRPHAPPVVMISGHADIQTAVECTRLGAFDFLEKPLSRERLLVTARNALAVERLGRENAELKGGLEREAEILGQSPGVRRVLEAIDKAAPTRATVAIYGESGTGKELVARAIHRKSLVSDGPFVQVNCAAIPEELIESELFGHEKGSFTGAIRKQLGKFVAADKGTIFLDEVGDMSLKTQAKVLRVLQSGEVETVGAERIVVVEVRVIAATNKNLPEEISRGAFREDLYYRLNVIPITMPPLSQRREDIPLLVEHFLRRFAERHGRKPKHLTPAALAILGRQSWRGNVRELENFIERLMIMVEGQTIDVGDLPLAPGGLGGLAGVGLEGAAISAEFMEAASLKIARDQAERAYIVAKLEQNNWNVSHTAEVIDTPRSNLYKKMEQYGIRRDENR